MVLDVLSISIIQLKGFCEWGWGDDIGMAFFDIEGIKLSVRIKDIENYKRKFHILPGPKFGL